MNKKVLCSGIVLIVIMAATGFTYDYIDAIEKGIWFFDANKCGPNAGQDSVCSSWRGACHTSDADGSINLTGGYHDAGDHVKFGLPQFWSASMIGWTLYEYRDLFDGAGLTTKTLSTLKYFTDFILKCHSNSTTLYYEVGNGDVDHSYWGPPENQTGARPAKKANLSSTGSDVCGQAAAALVLMYLNYQSTNSSYANQCLSAAREIYDIGITNLGRCDEGSFYPSTSHYDDLAWAAIWLNVAGGSSSLLDDVEYWMDTTENDYGDDNYAKEWSPAWDDCTVPVLVMMAFLTGNEKFRWGVINNLTWYRDECTQTPYGLPWLDTWGVLRYASSEAGIGYLAYKLLNWDGYLETGELTMDYTLGSNPRNASYITNYLNNPPRHPHHRANEPNRDGNTKGMVGALVGGPGSNDEYTDDVNDYTLNEVALDYNASFLLGMAGIAWFTNGGTPDPTPTLDPSITPTPTPWGAEGDIKVQYKCGEPSETSTQIKPHINIVNQSSESVDLSELTLRYYYTKDGLPDEEFHSDYSVIGAANVTGTVAYEYVEIGFTSGAGQLSAGSQTGEIQCRVNRVNWTNYNQTNDYSFDPSYTDYANYMKITLYRNGTLINGFEPGFEGTPGPTDPVTETPAPTTAPTVPPGDCNVSFNPENSTQGVNSIFQVDVIVNSGSQKLAAYGFFITYNSTILSFVDIEEGVDGFLAGGNKTNPGGFMASGFDSSGTGPGSNLQVLIITFKAIAAGTSTLGLNVDQLVDSATNPIGNACGNSGSVTVTDVLQGDTNGDGLIDIVDALLLAQYYVDLNPSGFNPGAADTDCNGSIDIIDALLIAQYYVDLISNFC